MRLAIGGLAMLPAILAAQQRGTIIGRVIDRGTSQPIASAQITILGTRLGTLTDAQGRYRVAGVAPGSTQVRAQRVGYEAATQTVAVTGGSEVTADFSLNARAISIDEVVVTATGETQRARESGVLTGRINTDSINLAPVTSASDLLQSRVPGVEVLPSSGTAGANSRIRIRGANSLSLSNDPLIIIDGVRVNNSAASNTIGVGGQQPSRLDDLNPEDIENIEIVKGPAAAALYGTAASNGVLYITTKQGRAGKTRWSAHAGGGPVKETATFPANFAALDADGGLCTTDLVAIGACSVTSTQSFNPLETFSPFTTGSTQNYGLSVAGGTDRATFYIAGDFSQDQGVYSWNRVTRNNVRANVHGQLSDKADVTASIGYLQSYLRLPQNDNNVLGVYGGGLLGGTDSSGSGYLLGQTPQEISAIKTLQNVQRLTTSATSNWQALPWLKFVGTVGLDLTNQGDHEVVPPGKVFFADLPQGQVTSNPLQDFFYTANGGATATFQLRPHLQSTTSAGVQYNNETTRGTLAFGETLVPGTGSLSGTTQFFAVAETTFTNITVGAYVQEQLAWHDRLFLSGALRGDKNSAFGQEFKSILYPSASVSWVIGDEPFFPKINAVSSLRLRAAYGESGQRPNFRDAITYYSPEAVTVNGQDEAGFTVGGVGNPQLKAERSREVEVGFDAGFLQERFGLQFTYYNKQTSDALIARPLPLSNGEAFSRFENLGKVQNSGVEALLTAQVLRLEPFAWTVSVNASTNHNKVVNLGEGISPILINDGHQRHQNGYALGGYWQLPILSYSDANGDGVLGPDEVTLGDTAVYLGTPLPTREVSINSSMTFFKYFRITGLLDYRGGQKLFNETERFRCVAFQLCKTANDPNSPLAQQAAYIAGLLGSDAGYIEDASFWKLRELSLTVSAPQQWANRFRASNVSLTLSGRNLHTWTKYTGFDPEVISDGAGNFSVSDFLTQPPVRYYTVRLDVTW
jgi:TonB-dependent SusC/RagA subfamily outer membrane receptor